MEYDPKNLVVSEAVMAKLKTVVNGVALRHGLQGSFFEVQLDMWRTLRTAVQAECLRAEMSQGVAME